MAANSVPSGTVTFVFTDIEGSTQRWESDPKSMEQALRRHDRIVRETLDEHGGYVFKTVGDAFCAAFERPRDAVEAALAVQQALTHEDFSNVKGLTVRAAIHSGVAEQRDGDYFGQTVNRVARLLAVGHGGQTLISAATAELVRDTLHEGSAALRDLGEHRLRDLSHPMHIYQVSAQDLDREFPPLRSLAVHPNNLPLEMTSFIGRTGDIAQIVHLYEQHRVVTIAGAGGIGKTRTALHVAGQLLDGYDDGAWLVDLAPLTEGALIPSAIAQTLELKITNGNSASALAAELRNMRVLIVLDNCEHVIEAAAQVASILVHQCPNVRVLATSRQPLGIAGEATYALPSLPLPNAAHVPELSALAAASYGAVELFVARATSVNARFALSDSDAPTVAEICLLLDGIPLAIELAAARTKMLGPAKLRELLGERFRVLSGGSRDALPRHQTMRATIDWSHGLLDDAERTLLRRLGIFAGGWTLDAVQAVCADEPLRNADVFDLQFSLTEKSLVSPDIGSGETRYRLLESTRAYALEKLEEAGEKARLAQKHAEWVADFAERAYERTWTTALARWTPAVEAEFDNVRAALSWAFGPGGDPVLGGAIAGALVTFWYRRPMAGLEGRRWIDTALAAIDEASHERIVARLYFTQALIAEGELSIDRARRALALYERLGDRFHIAFTYRQLAVSLLQAGRAAEALEAVDLAIETFDRSGTTSFWPYATAKGVRGQALTALGRIEEARAMFADSISRFEANGDEQRAAFHRLNFARLEFGAGDYRLALKALRDGLEVIHDTPYFGHEASARAIAAACHLMLDELDEAAGEASAALVIGRRANSSRVIAVCIQHIATVVAERGDAAFAARLCGYADEWYRSANVVRERTEAAPYERLLSRIESTLSVDERRTLFALGARLSEEQATSEAIAAASSRAGAGASAR
jgi:predicted ATPase/class 3 adenylate cyclase